MTTPANRRFIQVTIALLVIMAAAIIAYAIKVIREGPDAGPVTCATAQPDNISECTVPLPSNFCPQEDDCEADYASPGVWIIRRTEH